jgi:glutamate racemase
VTPPPTRIGVFDSGVGGLTVLRALLPRLPHARFTYLGDTARLPYGSKSQATIARYAVSSARFLVDEGADFLVIACNTASALALDQIRAASPVPVLGVIETGANAARAASSTGDVLVIATAATVESHAYSAACRQRHLRAIEKACPLLVPLVEEGWIAHPVTTQVIDIYLAELLAHARRDQLQPDTLVLGCTHYPLLRAQIEERLARQLDGPSATTGAGHPAIRVIDSAEATAEQVCGLLGIDPNGNSRSSAHDSNPAPGQPEPRCAFYATDSVTKFRTLGTRFLGHPIDEVQLVDLGG